MIQAEMKRNDTYFIPYLDKYIIYQPLNHLAFIGNSAMKCLVEDLLNGSKVNPIENKNALEFLYAHGIFNTFDCETTPPGFNDYNPTVCVLCLTSDCNFRCSYCFANGGEVEKTELSLEIGKRAIDLVHKNAVDTGAPFFEVSFHGGGEPTLPFQKLKRLTEYARAKESPSSVELTSNGYWNREMTWWIISNINKLTLSFDGVSDVQNRQRPLKNGEPSFDRIMSNIQLLDEAQVHYGIRLTVTNESVHSLHQNIEFLCRESDCATFQVEPAFAAGRALSNRQFIEDTGLFVKMILTAYDTASYYGRHLYYSGARPWVITNRFCEAHDTALVVTPTHNLSSCYEISGTEHPLAGAFHFGKLPVDGKPEIDVSKRTEFRKKIEERRKLCETCFCFWHCAGDCPAKTMRPEDFDNTTFSVRCDVNREITKELILRNILVDNDHPSVHY
jgi:uncharacterized protein